ncbi:MAG: hypothetical protein Q9214_004779 [Letrouitia sp. 1 TL-2023]
MPIQFAEKDNEDLSLLGRWASIALREQLAEIQRDIPELSSPEDRNELIPIASTSFHDQDVSGEQTFKVCIIGAGAAGLFTGMIFDHLKKEYDLDVEYEILEVNDEKRVGGRLFSHYFNTPPPGDRNHDYYDVGAMRYPDSKVMEPTFALFNVLDMKKYGKPEDFEEPENPENGWNPKPGNLVRYWLQGYNTVEMYNDVQLPIPPEGESTSTAQSFEITGLPSHDAKQTPGSLIKKQIKEYSSLLENCPQPGWYNMIERADKYSVRQFFLKNAFASPNIHDSGTAWYDQALSEMILESVNFDFNGIWWCIEGGSQEMAKRMYAKIEKRKPNRVSFNKKVIKMTYLKSPKGTTCDHKKINVHVAGEQKYRTYDAVFNSAPLGSMQRMDLRGLNLNWGTKQAIRSLGYGASCKVGIRFKEMWWMTKLGIKKGGVSKTDLPIRMCVYPSYNIHDNEPDPKDPKKGPRNVPGVLLCSYSWSLEAQRLGTLITRESPDGEDELKALLLDNLAKLHATKEWPYEKLHPLISDLYDDHFAYDWYDDKGTTGAFAYFGPGQFRNMYPYIIRNDGVHIIIGEAASAHHAWVVGAIESAVRGVYQFLYKHSKHSAKCNEVLQKYNHNKVEPPYGPIPKEFDRTKDVKPLNPNTGRIVTGRGKEDAELVSGNGEWLRQGVQVEDWRLQQGGDLLIPQDVKAEEVTEFTTLAPLVK